MQTLRSKRHLSMPHFVQKDVSEGFRLFEMGRFWQSHEAWEQAWKHLPRSHQKIFMQALIQLAACMVLLQDGRTRGFQRKRQHVLAKLTGFSQVGIVSIQGLCVASMIQHLAELEIRPPQWVAHSFFHQASYPRQEPTTHA